MKPLALTAAVIAAAVIAAGHTIIRSLEQADAAQLDLDDDDYWDRHDDTDDLPAAA